MGLWAYALREIARQRYSALLTLFGIAVGVASAVAAYSAIQSARGSYSELFDSLVGGAALEVHAPGEVGFDPAIVQALNQIEGILTVLPEVQGTAARPGWDGPLPVVVCGKLSLDDPHDGEAIVSTHLLEEARLKPGESLRLWGPTGQTDLTVVASPARSPLAGAAGEVITVSLPTAQHLFGLRDKVNVVRLVLVEGADLHTVEAAVAKQLPPGLCVRSPSRRTELTRGIRTAASQGLTGLTAVGLAGAAYVVFGIAQFHLLTRRRELAILRSLGATIPQVEGIFVRQAVILGLGGGLLGAVCGVFLTCGIVGGATEATGIAIASPQLGWEHLLLGTATGLGLSVLAIWLPSRELCCLSPVELFCQSRGVATQPCRGVWFVRACSAFSLAAGTWTLGECALGSIPPAWGHSLFSPALALIVAGMTGLVIPLLPRLLVSVEGLVSFCFGVCGSLAIRQLSRRPDRTARTSGVVFVTVVMTVGFGHSVLNTLADVRVWTDRAIPADFLVRASMPDPGCVLTTAIPESLGCEIKQLGGIESVEQITFISTTVGETPALVLARTFPADRPLTLDFRGGDPDKIRRALAAGEAILADGLARSLSVKCGDVISIATPHGSHQLRVGGTVNEYSAGGAAFYLDWDVAKSLFGSFEVHAFLVSAQHSQQAALDTKLTDFCRTRGLLLQRNQDLRKVVENLTRGLTAGLWALLAVTFAVAGLGVVSAVTVTGWEQRGESELLRVVGMVSWRVRRAFRLQAMLLTLAGFPLGVLCGLVVAFILNRAIQGLWGYGVAFCVEWEFLGGVLALTLITSMLAGVLCPVRAWSRES
jgi:putative ABC transport system permease protein